MALKAVAAPLGSPVGGTGTTNTIPRWTGPSTLGDSVITQNSTALVTTGSSSATQTTFRVRTVGTANNAPVFSLYREGVNEQVIWAGSGTIRFGFATDPAGYTDAQLLTATKMGIDSSGNVGIGTASPTAKLEIPSTASLAGIRVQLTAAPKNNYYNAEVHNFRNLSDLTRVAIDTVNNYIDASLASGWGLKLPATPGNADAQTLDCYAEGTWTPTLAGFVTNTPGTVTATYTRIGRMVTLNVYLYAGGSSFGSTLGTTTVTVPSGMTPNFVGVGIGGLSRTTGTVAQAIAYYDGKIYLGTSASAATEMWVSVTYYV